MQMAFDFSNESKIFVVSYQTKITALAEQAWSTFFVTDRFKTSVISFVGQTLGKVLDFRKGFLPGISLPKT